MAHFGECQNMGVIPIRDIKMLCYRNRLGLKGSML